MNRNATGQRLFFSLPSLLRVLALVGLCLLPMHMRAGAGHPHPHALLQLVLDARDGSFDHHRDGEPAAPSDHAPAAANGTDHARPDLPTFGDSVYAGGGLAVLLVLLATLLLSPTIARVWPAVANWRDRLPVVNPPPPRLARV